MALWTPADTTTALWLDGADSATVFDAVSGGSTPAADGAIYRLEDKSGNGRHATQSTLTNCPIRKVASQNGLDSVLFDGSNDILVTSWVHTYPASIFWIGSLDDAVTTTQKVAVSASTALTQPSFDIGQVGTVLGAVKALAAFNSYSNIGCYFNNGMNRAGAIDLMVDAMLPTSLANHGTTPWNIGKNGSNLTPTARTNGTTYAGSTIKIGSTLAGYQPWNGRIHEVVIISEVVTDDLKEIIRGYLAWKWGLEGDLPIGHPYKSAAPTTGNPTGILQNNIQSIRLGL